MEGVGFAEAYFHQAPTERLKRAPNGRMSGGGKFGRSLSRPGTCWAAHDGVLDDEQGMEGVGFAGAYLHQTPTDRLETAPMADRARVEGGGGRFRDPLSRPDSCQPLTFGYVTPLDTSKLLYPCWPLGGNNASADAGFTCGYAWNYV
jgi:hypothetical protein